jgi:flagellar biosynthesis/type III secretory pathway protein FliH
LTNVERYEYDEYWDIIRTENTLIEGKLAEGYNRGMEKGMEKGEQKKEIEFVLNLADNGFSIE